MRLAGGVLLAACGEPSASGPFTIPPTTRAPVDPNALSEMLPKSVNGVATTRADIKVLDRSSPKVFAKVVAGLHKTPQDAEVALSYAEDARVYALRVDGASGMDILQGFVAERQGAAAGSVPPPTVSVGGKQVTRIGSIAGAYLYASADVFFYVDCPDEPTGIDILQQLP
jgi:hypothetical protein